MSYKPAEERKLCTVNEAVELMQARGVRGMGRNRITGWIDAGKYVETTITPAGIRIYEDSLPTKAQMENVFD